MELCTNCSEKIYGDEEDIKYIHSEPYCSECYNELKSELEEPDWGDDGRYNSNLED